MLISLLNLDFGRVNLRRVRFYIRHTFANLQMRKNGGKEKEWGTRIKKGSREEVKKGKQIRK